MLREVIILNENLGVYNTYNDYDLNSIIGSFAKPVHFVVRP